MKKTDRPFVYGDRLMRERNYLFDNIKFFMIFFVVFAHLLEPEFGDSTVKAIYSVIYSFHMPVFIFVMGYFAKFSPAKIFRSVLLPYAVFQVLYLLFEFFVLGKNGGFVLQFSRPYWIMWFLLVSFFYHAFIPLFDCQKKSSQYIFLAASLIAALLAGYDKTISYHMSLSRFFVFLPFFLAGFYYGKSEKKLPANTLTKALSAVAVLAAAVVLVAMNPDPQILYGSYPYEKLHYGPLIRLFITAAACCWIVFWLVWTPKIRIPFVSTAGRNTLTIFLIHGFIVKYLNKTGILSYETAANISIAFLISVLILICLGNNQAGKLMSVFRVKSKE